jgi:hypothetical protein
LLVVKNKEWAQCTNCEEQVAMEDLADTSRTSSQDEESLQEVKAPREVAESVSK